MSKPNSGLFKGTVGEKSENKKTEEELKEEAINSVKELIAKTKKAKRRGAFVGAYDIETGHVEADVSGNVPENIHPELKELAEKRVGQINSNGLTKTNTVGRCAEFHVVNKMLNAGCEYKNIRLTKAFRFQHETKQWEAFPYCENCLGMFKEILNIDKNNEILEVDKK